MESVNLINETPIKESIQLKEPIKRIAAFDNLEVETHSKYLK